MSQWRRVTIATLPRLGDFAGNLQRGTRLAMPRAAGGDRMPRRRHAWCVAGLVWAAAALVAAVPVPDEEVLASLLDGDEQQTAGEWVPACADTCVPGLRTVRTGYAYQPPACCTY